jgi:hypothetical protein
MIGNGKYLLPPYALMKETASDPFTSAFQNMVMHMPTFLKVLDRGE